MAREEQQDVRQRIEDAVFGLMKTIDIPDIRIEQVVKLASTSRSTFYRYFRSVDAVVKKFEDALLENMQGINDLALKGRFGTSELVPTHSMIARMELLRHNRDKVIVLNGPHGDPAFVRKATVFMHSYFRERIKDVEGDALSKDFYLSFVIAGHHNLIQYWLEELPEIEPETVAALLNRLYYAPFFVDDNIHIKTPRLSSAKRNT
ncbi:TetR/AcrR family transcriptional regulator [Lancefieldella rimae]|uniref:TetR/AcrR family transcriptional regulator n=1 Tax=Lancefieldella rimae TaxID=1383 RepID=UPI003A8E6F25